MQPSLPLQLYLGTCMLGLVVTTTSRTVTAPGVGRGREGGRGQEEQEYWQQIGMGQQEKQEKLQNYSDPFLGPRSQEWPLRECIAILG